MALQTTEGSRSIEDTIETAPVASRESFEAYCAALGIEPAATRQATVTAALAGMLASLESTVDAAYAALASGSLKKHR